MTRRSAWDPGTRRAATVAIAALLLAAGVASVHAHGTFDDPTALRVADVDTRVRTTSCVACVLAHVGVVAEEFVVVGRPLRATNVVDPASSPIPPVVAETRHAPRGPPASV